MTSLLALLSQQTPSLSTRKALIILGLQNDFNAPSGKLPVTTDLDYLDKISQLVPGFREHGDIIWVRSEFEANRPIANPVESGCSVIVGPPRENRPEDVRKDSSQSPKTDRKSPVHVLDDAVEDGSTFDIDEEDEELFLCQHETRKPCCVKNSWGAEYTEKIAPLIKTGDMQVTKSYYSAFSSTSLLMTLRSKLITELYVCGNMTNISVYATAMDAARYGIKITLVENCLGYRKRERHDRALHDLVEIMEAAVLPSTKVLDILENPPDSEEESDEEDEVDEDSDASASDEVARSHASAAPNLAGVLEPDSEEDEDNSDDDAARVRPVRSSGKPNEAEIPHQALRDLQLADVRSSTTRHARTTHDEYRSNTNFKCPGATTGSPEASYSSGHEGVASRSLDQGEAGTAGPLPRSFLSDAKPMAAALDTVDTQQTNSTSFYESVAFQDCEGHEIPSRSRDYIHTSPFRRTMPLFGEDRHDESAGSSLIHALLDATSSKTIFDVLKDEIKWQRMLHQTGEVPRLVCCQATIGEDGSIPVYRHPSDYTLPAMPWSSNVDRVRRAAEAAAGHPLNHALIQLYRGGSDFISEHSDKTLDIAPGSSIVNVSFGAQRVMRLRTKRTTKSLADSSHDQLPTSPPPPPSPRTTHRVPLPHNSMIQMSLPTNATYLHGIMPDKRPAVELTDAEKANNGHRISLTFRYIKTFLSKDGDRMWGQGAKGKTADSSRPVVNGDEVESAKLVAAFGAENRAGAIERQGIYGDGFDVLHLKGRLVEEG
ncbi:hypothetical protein MBLNU230_g4075t1 [Neophaeotheca triangularis]